MVQQNPILESVISNLRSRRRKYHIVEHREETKTVEEKKRLLRNHKHDDYRQYGQVEIVGGYILSYTREKNLKNILCLYDGRNERDNDKLRFELGLVRNVDLMPCQDIEGLIGSEIGAVSPFTTKIDSVNGIYFDRRMIDEARQNPSLTWDMTISTKLSLFANVADVYFALKQIPGFDSKTHIVRVT